jgi:hypothetical protein
MIPWGPQGVKARGLVFLEAERNWRAKIFLTQITKKTILPMAEA